MLERIRETIEAIETAENLQEITNLKKIAWCLISIARIAAD
jgi:hypothetical protein